MRKLVKLQEVHRLDVSLNRHVTLTAIAETILQMPKVVDLEIVGICSGRRNRLMCGGVKACPLPTQLTITI